MTPNDFVSWLRGYLAANGESSIGKAGVATIAKALEGVRVPTFPVQQPISIPTAWAHQMPTYPVVEIGDPAPPSTVTTAGGRSE